MPFGINENYNFCVTELSTGKIVNKLAVTV